MKPVHVGLWLGLGYTLPAVVWLLGAYDRQPAWGSRLLPALAVVQTVAVILVAPWRPRRSDWREEPLGILLLLTVPLPLVAICWLAGAVDPVRLLRLQLVLLSLGLLLWLVSRRLAALLPGWSRQAAVTALQGGTAVMLWLWREPWLRVLTP